MKRKGKGSIPKQLTETRIQSAVNFFSDSFGESSSSSSSLSCPLPTKKKSIDRLEDPPCQFSRENYLPSSDPSYTQLVCFGVLRDSEERQSGGEGRSALGQSLDSS